MEKCSFFKTTPLYKEFSLLSAISRYKHITQRDIAIKMNVSVTMVNFYLDEYEEKGLIKRVYHGTKSIDYFVTDKGEERRKELSIRYLESALDVYNEAKLSCNVIFKKLRIKNFKKILFYGAGEVCEMLLSVLNSDQSIDLDVIAVIDDDNKKIGKKILDKDIISLNEITNLSYDGILISTYTHTNAIYQKLIEQNIDKEKIVSFF